MGTIRRFDINNLRYGYNLDRFVETGTLLGDGVDYALSSGFKNITTIEIEADLVQKAKEKYKNNPEVTVLHGNSFDVLKELIPTLTSNCLFWLDAHFPGADLNHKAYNSEPDMDVRLPLEKELDLIFEHRKNFTDVIIADDLWLYEDEELCEIGSFDAHMKRCGHNLTRNDVLSNKNLDFIRNKLGDKYELKKYYGDQGYIVLVPQY